MLTRILQYIVMENVSLGMYHGIPLSEHAQMPFHRNQIIFLGTLCITITERTTVGYLFSFLLLLL